MHADPVVPDEEAGVEMGADGEFEVWLGGGGVVFYELGLRGVLWESGDGWQCA